MNDPIAPTAAEFPVQQQLDAYNARDIDAFMQWWSDDCEYYEFPARLLATAGEPARGVLAAGARGDLVVLDSEYAAVATVIAGRVVHDPGGLIARPV